MKPSGSRSFPLQDPPSGLGSNCPLKSSIKIQNNGSLFTVEKTNFSTVKGPKCNENTTFSSLGSQTSRFIRFHHHSEQVTCVVLGASVFFFFSGRLRYFFSQSPHESCGLEGQKNTPSLRKEYKTRPTVREVEGDAC